MFVKRAVTGYHLRPAKTLFITKPLSLFLLSRATPPISLTNTSKKIRASLQNGRQAHPINCLVTSKMYFCSSVPHFLSPKIQLPGFAGYQSIVDRLSDIALFLKHPKATFPLGARAPKGVIFSGPPGVGKTLLIQALAKHMNVSLIEVCGSDFKEMYVGESEKKLRQTFENAKKMAPCILCIDEIDSIGTKRSYNLYDSRNENSIVNQLIRLLSEDHPGVIVMAATNRFDVLDEALVRAGRFDRKIIMDLPNKNDREAILRLLLKDKKLHPALPIEKLASSLSVGFSGAQLALWVNEAVLCALKEESDCLMESHFKEAQEFMILGVKAETNTNHVQKYYIAVHEAGHALVGYLLGQKLDKVSVYTYGIREGHTRWSAQDEDVSRTEKDLLNEICICLAGRANEEIFEITQEGSALDLDQARSLATRMTEVEGMGRTLSRGNAEDIEIILQQQMVRAKKLLSYLENREACLRIIDALIIHNELNLENFRRVLSGRPIEPPEKRKVTILDIEKLLPLDASETADTGSLQDDYPFA